MSAHQSPDEARTAFRALASIVIVVLLVFGSTVAVRAAYGAFSDDFKVRTRFERAGQGLRSGSDVKYRGVNVGKVRSVELRDRQVDVVLQLRKGVEVPKDTVATVRPKTLFGEKFVELDDRKGDEPPFLEDGDRVAAGGVGVEVEELLDTTDDLLGAVDADELAILMDELVTASRGEGDRVAALIDQSVEATAVIDDTMDAQLRAIDSFQRFMREYRDVGPAINATNANLNELLPSFNVAKEDYERLLRSLRPFADHLAGFIEVNEADLDQLLDDGDNIVRVLTARKQNISETIRGLDHYTATLADAVAPGTLPDGTRYGNMKLFLDFSDLRGLLCLALGPTGPGAQLGPVHEALAARVPELSCDDAPGGAGDGSLPIAGGSTGAGSGSGSEAPADEADPTTDIASALASPDASTDGGTVGDLLAPLLGEAG